MKLLAGVPGLSPRYSTCGFWGDIEKLCLCLAVCLGQTLSILVMGDGRSRVGAANQVCGSAVFSHNKHVSLWSLPNVEGF